MNGEHSNAPASVTTDPGVRTPTHLCKICGALWIYFPHWPTQNPGSWSLFSHKCGQCCDNVAMGEQIEPIYIALERLAGAASLPDRQTDYATQLPALERELLARAEYFPASMVRWARGEIERLRERERALLTQSTTSPDGLEVGNWKYGYPDHE